MGSGFRRVALLGVALSLVAPACGGQSISKEGDGNGGTGGSPDDDDIVGDDDFGGTGGSTPGQGGVGPTGGTLPAAGSGAVGGTFPTGGVSTTGGQPPTGGVGAIPGSGGTIPTAGVGGTGDVNADPQCKGILRDMTCSPDGKVCNNLKCGIADSGRRACNCATTWACTSCDYTNSPFRDRPAMIKPCPPGAADEAFCTEVNTVCGPMGAEYCACYSDPTDGLIWDCDSPPSTWPI